ncbi:hypothetical protein LXA43DRAFT_170738 [Ganoderma leucocontextum]|nr:hypothetical protein LXA43DRAFT_170738 [Ganoderma leucocontextum]
MPVQAQHENETARPLLWSDALVAAPTTDDKWAVTSPNMDFVPSPPIGLIQVVLRADCRYSLVDPIQWPQAFSDGFEYLAAVLRSDTADDTLVPIWWSPRREDFELIQGSVIKCLGLLRRACVQPLSLVSYAPSHTYAYTHILVLATMTPRCVLNRLSVA